jgi:hypothetical protein
VRRIVASLTAGLLCGAVVGGLGGRLAMFILRLTSDDSLRGLKTDDDFEIGQVSGGTFFLVFACAFLGLFGGALYAVLAGFVPRLMRVGVTAALAGVAGGATILKPGEFDFTVIHPPLLSVVLFIAVPALFGVALSWLAERWANDGFELDGVVAAVGRVALAGAFAFLAVDTVTAAVDIV